LQHVRLIFIINDYDPFGKGEQTVFLFEIITLDHIIVSIVCLVSESVILNKE